MEPSIHFRETNTDLSVHFRKANMDPSMHCRKANKEVLVPTLLTISFLSLYPFQSNGKKWSQISTFLFKISLKSTRKKKFFLLILPYKTWWKPRFPMD